MILHRILLLPLVLVSPLAAHAAPSKGHGSSPSYDPAIIQANAGSRKPPPKKDSAFTCRALSIAMGDLLFTSGVDAEYQDAIEENYSATCWLPAACVAKPTDAAQVGRVMTILDQLNTPFSIRSGGHKQNPGYGSVSEKGVLISLANLNTLSLSDDKSTALVGPGNRWQAVYDYLVPQGLVAIGGRVGDVGVGGFMLGGGMSYYSNMHGLGVDNVKSYEVVLASGEIVNASATQNSDLYQGLRGGSSNFGIVTMYELNVYPTGMINFEARAYSLNQTNEVLTALADFNNEGIQDGLSAMGMQVQETGPVVLLLYMDAVDKPKCYQPFYDISPFTQYFPATNGTLLDALALSSGGFPPVGVRTYGETFSHTVDAAFMIEAYDIFAAEVAKLPEGATGTWIPNPVSLNMVELGKRNGGNLLGLSAVPQQWHEWNILWDDAADDEAIYAIADTITKKLNAAAKKAGTLLPYIFMNTAGTKQPVLKSLGAANVRTIKRVAAKYDPDRVFQRLQNAGALIRDL